MRRRYKQSLFLADARNKKRARPSSDVTLEEQLKREMEMREQEGLLALTAEADPVLAELWDNEKDAAYDRL